MRPFLLACTTMWAAFAMGPSGRAADPAPSSTAAVDPHPDLTRLSAAEDVWVDPARREVIVGGAIALDRGPIEVFACPRQTKEHEAIVATSASARTVHAALLAIGLEPGRPVSFDPEYAAAHGPGVRVLVRWRDAAGRAVERPARDLVRNAQTKGPLAADWVFAGSSFWRDPADGQEYYQADGGDLICVSNFPTATLDLPIESSQANEELMFEAFAERIPPRGTPVELVLSAVGQEAQPTTPQ
ncbi:MAG: YdjY domain-containing protein [Planctomycetaceae bacterium]